MMAFMAGWSDEELRAIGEADELRLTSRRADGSLRPPVTIWVVEADGRLAVRSGWGRGNGWFRRALVTRRGRVEAGGVARDVRFEEAGDAAHEAIDAAYHAKYDRFGASYVDPVVSAESHTATFLLTPED